MNDDRETLLILGGSTRAAAFSARAAGLQVACGDLYGDADLQATCPVTMVPDYPSGLEKVAREAPAGPWMYTGALENHPRLVERIAASRPLLGNPAEVLRRVRDPFLVAETLRSAGLPAPECAHGTENVPRDGTLLRKQKRSAGGLQVEVWQGEVCDQPVRVQSDASHWYFQRRMEGLSCSAVYLADQYRACLLGVTEQLVGPQFGQQREHVPAPFCYAGSIGPLEISQNERQPLQRMGDVLADKFKLRGLFGVDLIFCEGNFYPIEVNPRYTASMELLERHLARSFVAWHVEACRTGSLPTEAEICGVEESRQTMTPRIWHGKAIVYARSSVEVTHDMTAQLLAENEQLAWPVVADIPAAGTALLTGQPVTTVFADGDSREEIVRRLDERVRWCWEMFGG